MNAVLEDGCSLCDERCGFFGGVILFAAPCDCYCVGDDWLFLWRFILLLWRCILSCCASHQGGGGGGIIDVVITPIAYAMNGDELKDQADQRDGECSHE